MNHLWDFLLQVFALVNRHNVFLRITHDLVSSVSEEFTVCTYRRLSVDGSSLFFQNSISVTKKVFSCERKQPIKEDVSYHYGWFTVIVCVFVQSEVPFSDPSVSCLTPCWPSDFRWLVAVLPQGNICLYWVIHTAFFGLRQWVEGREAWQCCGSSWDLLQHV